MSTETGIEAIDPVTLEVLRMRLDAIVQEMGLAMMRSSGSPTITESGDLNTALFDPEGRIYSYSDYVQLHIGSGSVSIRRLLDALDGAPPAPGDVFICNDPHSSGASHAPDTNIISPVFYDGELVAWAQSQAHLIDVGGMAPGGFAPAAHDCYSEGLRIPPGVKLFDAGEPVKSIHRVIVNNVRMSSVFWNDVRSLVASNNTGISRLLTTIEEFGLDEFRRYTEAAFNLAEQVVRERILLIADGVYEADEWIEDNGHRSALLRLHCQLTKTGDHITLDFNGSSLQTDGYVNCSLGATLGQIASAVMPIIAWDVPFNDGVMSAFDVLAPKGTIVNPTPPAPISNGHIITGGRVSRIVTKLLNEALASSDSSLLRSRTQGIWAESWVGAVSSGTRTDTGEYFVMFNMDGGGMGSGAQAVADGLDCGGMMTEVNSTIPDVEMHEMMYPVMYLWRRLSPASAGPGAFRGGMGIDFAWALLGAEHSEQTVFASVASVVADGFGGGLPGGGSGHEIWRNTNVHDLIDAGQELTEQNLAIAERDLLAINQQGVPMGREDIFHQWIAGGGGYGDPLLRDPEQVARDYEDEYVTRRSVQDVFGVILDPSGAVDSAATDSVRMRIRQQRVGSSAPLAAVRADATGTDSAPLQVDGHWICPASATDLGTGEHWRQNAVLRTSSAHERLAELGITTRSHDDADGYRVLLDEFFSPGCGTLLDARLRVEQIPMPTP